VSRPGLSTTRENSDALESAAPEPLEHATPDAELAAAQMALGRPERELEAGGEDEPESVDEFELEAEDAAEAFDLDEYEDSDPVESGPGEAIVGGGGRPPRRRRGASGDGSGDDSGGSGGELEEAAAPVPAVRQNIFSRLIHFVQGSWRELQRVQWPDRRQVMQATGVVIGFVIVAGVFLGVADFLAGKLVNFILK
jgi:preprotein translocase subunit SecE